jgi:hypothetical protein
MTNQLLVGQQSPRQLRPLTLLIITTMMTQLIHIPVIARASMNSHSQNINLAKSGDGGALSSNSSNPLLQLTRIQLQKSATQLQHIDKVNDY